MNNNIAHEAYRDHIKAGRSVILLVVNHQIGRNHIRKLADFYNFRIIDTNYTRIIFESGRWLRVYTTNNHPAMMQPIIAGTKEVVVLTDQDAFHNLNKYKIKEFMSCAQVINERTLGFV